MFSRIRKIELEIQTLNNDSIDVDNPSMFYWFDIRKKSICFVSYLIINISVKQYISRLMLYDNDYLSESIIFEWMSVTNID